MESRAKTRYKGGHAPPFFIYSFVVVNCPCRRAQWWLTFYEMSEGCSIPEFRDLYGKAVDQLIAQFELPISEIRNRQQVYKQLLGI
jgi:hypothetical protein